MVLVKMERVIDRFALTKRISKSLFLMVQKVKNRNITTTKTPIDITQTTKFMVWSYASSL